MSKRKSPEAQPLSRGVILFVRALIVGALLVSIYLAYVSFGGSTIAGCGPDSGCDKVLNSRWSRWFGIPVSVPAVLLYALMLATTMRLAPRATAAQQRQAWSIMLPAAWVVLGAVAWFAALQLFVIKAFCPYCMAAHACGLVAALIVVFNAPIRDPGDKPWQQEKEVYVRPKSARSLLASAAAAVLLLAGGQVIYRPAQFGVSRVGAPLGHEATGRFFQIYDGRFAFDMNEVPLIGSPAARARIVSLFDYTCHHCRIMHGHIKELHKSFSKDLAIVSLPMPLDSQCNFTVRMTSPSHSNACEYARLGLAVWRANREVHRQFDDWLFAPEHPPGLSLAREQAARLVGAQRLEAALTNDWVEECLQLGIRVYATNFVHVRQGNLPQLIIGTNLITGSPPLDDLYGRLEDQLGLKRPDLSSKAQ